MRFVFTSGIFCHRPTSLFMQKKPHPSQLTTKEDPFPEIL